MKTRSDTLDDLHLDLLRTMVMAARQNDMDVALGWRVLLALLDEIHALRSQLSERPAHATPPELVALRTEAAHEQTTVDESVGAGGYSPGLVCPECGKSGFTRVTGYKAHLRITHGIQ
jgi:hypothetical protein